MIFSEAENLRKMEESEQLKLEFFGGSTRPTTNSMNGGFVNPLAKESGFLELKLIESSTVMKSGSSTMINYQKNTVGDPDLTKTHRIQISGIKEGKGWNTLDIIHKNLLKSTSELAKQIEGQESNMKACCGTINVEDSGNTKIGIITSENAKENAQFVSPKMQNIDPNVITSQLAQESPNFLPVKAVKGISKIQNPNKITFQKSPKELDNINERVGHDLFSMIPVVKSAGIQMMDFKLENFGLLRDEIIAKNAGKSRAKQGGKRDLEREFNETELEMTLDMLLMLSVYQIFTEEGKENGDDWSIKHLVEFYR